VPAFLLKDRHASASRHLDCQPLEVHRHANHQFQNATMRFDVGDQVIVFDRAE
jgi:hypothetical protein